MVGSPFSGEVFSPFSAPEHPLRMRDVQSGSTAAFWDRDQVEWRKKVWILGNDRKTDVEWGSNRCCQVSSVKFGTIHLNFSWFSVDAGCVYELGMYVCMYVCACLWVSMYCMSLRGLWAQQSLDSGVDVSSSSNKGLKVGLAVDEAHGAQLIQLGLEPHFWGLGLQEAKNKSHFKNTIIQARKKQYPCTRASVYRCASSSANSTSKHLEHLLH